MVMAASTKEKCLNRIREVLEQVPDPEIPVLSIVDLGIVRAVDLSRVALTPTYSGCPATQEIAHATRAALDKAGFADVAVDLVLSPAWSTSMISSQGHEKLRAYGIAPPDSTPGPAQCPRCSSTQTHEVSRFGSTPCKALWQCDDCREPFDRFKCH
jgi:ring-1,2-phenylacetyl-CoA epoxidase subunit PaaD